MKLFSRVTVLVAVILAVSLVVADVVTYGSLRSFLYGRLDAELGNAQHLAANYLEKTPKPNTLGLVLRIEPDVYVLVIGPSGAVVAARASGPRSNPDPPPVLPAHYRRLPEGRPGSRGAGGEYVPSSYAFNTTGPPGSSITYRVEVAAVPQGILVTAVSFIETRSTLSSVLRVELASSVVVLAVLCMLTLWIVRRRLRPLEEMARTAKAITRGDLSRRVDEDGRSTEVGRLGVSLNGMLTQIETAFGEKSSSERRLRRFVADASHELRTPLTSIRGYAELLRKGGFTDEESRGRALARIESEAARMGGIVDDLLLLARLDQGRPLEEVDVDLSGIASEIVEDARAVDPGRRIDVTSEGRVVVKADRDRLTQAISNLLSNAMAHTPAGTPVEVRVLAQADRGILEVRDEGPGMEAEEAERVFDRFWRGDASRSTDGTGLGLSIVRAITEALGGEAKVRSAPGEGTRFSIELPLVDQGVPPTEAPVPPAHGRSRRGGRHSTPHRG